MRKFVLVCAVSALAAVSAAGDCAAGPPPPGQGPCYADLERFCPNVPFGEGRRITCLSHHLTQLSSAECRRRVPILLKIFAYGQQQKTKVQAYLKKHNPEGLNDLDKESSSPPPAKPAPK